MAHYIYGKNVVRQRLLSQEKIHRLLLSKNKPDQSFVELAKKHNIPINYLNDYELKKFEGVHQNVIAEVDDFRYFTLDEVLRDVSDQACFVILDSIEDPHNLGAILRSADAAGISAIIIPKHGSVSLNATVAKVSTGAIDTVPTVMVTNLNQCIDTLKEKGFWIYASDLTDQSQDYRKVKYADKCALVIGSEGHGISRLVLKNSDVIVKIPMMGQVTSLNASVSAALLMYEVLNQRLP
jgi:23S rRNA (guanosine2251-2'-O)-methyltransferase